MSGKPNYNFLDERVKKVVAARKELVDAKKQLAEKTLAQDPYELALCVQRAKKAIEVEMAEIKMEVHTNDL